MTRREPKIGERVGVFMSADDPNVDVPLWQGILVAHGGPVLRFPDRTNMLMLADPSEYYPRGTPLTFRNDQVFVEQTISDRLTPHIRDIQNATIAERVRLHKAWFRKDTEALFALVRAEQSLLAIQSDLRAQEPPKKNFRDEICYDALPKGSPVEIDLSPGKAYGTFICDFRGWRFFRYDNGAYDGLEPEKVRPLVKVD